MKPCYLIAACLLATPAAATTYQYAIDFEFPAFMGVASDNFARGTITTDCNNCNLYRSDVVAWNLTVSVGTDSSVLTNGNSTFFPAPPGDLVATPDGLYYNFQAALTGPSGFSDSYAVGLNSNPQFVLDQGTLAWAAGTTYIYLYSVPNYPPSDVIGTAIAGVPEPSTWAMLLTGFALLGGWRWRSRHSVQKS
jgi:hypothetical protein